MEILLIALESKLHSKLMITGDTLLKDKGHRLLPGLQLTSNRLFFISYAQVGVSSPLGLD